MLNFSVCNFRSFVRILWNLVSSLVKLYKFDNYKLKREHLILLTHRMGTYDDDDSDGGYGGGYGGRSYGGNSSYSRPTSYSNHSSSSILKKTSQRSVRNYKYYKKERN